MNKPRLSITVQNLVESILDHKIYLENLSERMIDKVMGIGTLQKKVAGELIWLINYVDDDDLAEKMHALNSLGFLFVGEPGGWPPAEGFDYVRKKDFLCEKFKEIRWRGPDDWFIIER